MTKEESESLSIEKFVRCEACRRYKSVKSQKTIGDNVEYMDVVTTRNGQTLTSKVGKILSINGNHVIVKGRGRSRQVTVPIDELRDPEGATSVSFAMFGECLCSS